ncbi:MAG TPA: HlyD family efflux transporter periplasmic adaptor subunit [Azospirillaceae bacterium]|nr:HlyD family efflux transporter periplasmic adaptor subunit [Azospirillaceae bacterium]
MSQQVDPQLLGLTTLLQLQKRARHAATAEELGFLMVNDSFGLLRYRQAALWRRDEAGDGRVLAVSGLAAVEADAPYVLYLRRLLAGHAGADKPVPLTSATAGEGLQAEWTEYLPAHALAVPLTAPGGRRLGALLLARDEPFNDGERLLAETLADAYAHAWGALLGRQSSKLAGRLRDKRVRAGLAVGAVLLALFPVRQSALAPAEVVAREPTVVRAPFDGVVESFLVAPNQPVAEGEPLFRLDAVKLRNRLEVARSELQVAEAEHRQAAQQAVFDEKSKAGLAVLAGRRDQAAAEVAYVDSLLQRIEVRAPRAGTAIFADADDWIGRPVALGERILMLADPRAAELEARLPVADAIALEPGARIRLFLNVAPDDPVEAELVRAAYKPETLPDGTVAYRVKAKLAEGEAPRIGLRGTAKIYGERTVLFYYLFRRPLAALRQRIGL